MPTFIPSGFGSCSAEVKKKTKAKPMNRPATVAGSRTLISALVEFNIVELYTVEISGQRERGTA